MSCVMVFSTNITVLPLLECLKMRIFWLIEDIYPASDKSSGGFLKEDNTEKLVLPEINIILFDPIISLEFKGFKNCLTYFIVTVANSLKGFVFRKL